MKLSIFIDITLLGVIYFFVLKNKRSALENLFLFMILEFLLSCFYGVLFINLDVWTIGKQTEYFIIFRIYEVLLNPLLYLLYFNMLPNLGQRFSKLLCTILFVGFIFGIERLLVSENIIVYKDWRAWQSVISIACMLLVSFLLLKGYRYLLIKEGVRM